MFQACTLGIRLDICGNAELVIVYLFWVVGDMNVGSVAGVDPTAQPMDAEKACFFAMCRAHAD